MHFEDAYKEACVRGVSTAPCRTWETQGVRRHSVIQQTVWSAHREPVPGNILRNHNERIHKTQLLSSRLGQVLLRRQTRRQEKCSKEIWAKKWLSGHKKKERQKSQPPGAIARGWNIIWRVIINKEAGTGVQTQNNEVKAVLNSIFILMSTEAIWGALWSYLHIC